VAISALGVAGCAPQAAQQQRDQDQYNFTDPDSRIMKNSANQGFDQHYNVQVAVTQENLLIVGQSLSNHPHDQAEAEPTVDSIPTQLGKPTPWHWTMATLVKTMSPIWRRSRSMAIWPLVASNMGISLCLCLGDEFRRMRA
jgi:hypothetical protein